MRTTRLSIVIAIGVCGMMALGILASAAPWLAQESLFEFTAREPKNRTPAEPGDPPNGGDPGMPSSNSGLPDGPPSVS
ncbi:MAG TPA: hypothetical protein VNT26_11210 [Candidatus Sulfotelmatobacter sp.]|nr:hypothetical protein [Candidatus Sulfotelmatobacter sp.]